MITHQITTQKQRQKYFRSDFHATSYCFTGKQQIAGVALFKFLDFQTIHIENLASFDLVFDQRS